jgi:hypothetical protein
MPQLFQPRSNALFRFMILVVIIGAFGAVALAETISRSHYVTGKEMVAPQPVPFSHQHHAGELGINCLFCHISVTKSTVAGMPSTETCMHCHSRIWTHAPMLSPVRDSFLRDIPLRWRRVFSLPEYVYFDHSIHIAKGIGCSSCHGTMDRMQMTREAHVFTMKFCLSCHENPQKQVRPKNQILDMHWRPPADQAKIGRKLVALYHINMTGRLTDCSTCHR